MLVGKEKMLPLTIWVGSSFSACGLRGISFSGAVIWVRGELQSERLCFYLSQLGLGLYSKQGRAQ